MLRTQLRTFEVFSFFENYNTTDNTNFQKRTVIVFWQRKFKNPKGGN